MSFILRNFERLPDSGYSNYQSNWYCQIFLGMSSYPSAVSQLYTSQRYVIGFTLFHFEIKFLTPQKQKRERLVRNRVRLENMTEWKYNGRRLGHHFIRSIPRFRSRNYRLSTRTLHTYSTETDYSFYVCTGKDGGL